MKNIALILFMVPPWFLHASSLQTCTSNGCTVTTKTQSYTTTTVDNAVYIDVSTTNLLPGIKVFYLNGRYFTQNNGTIMSIRHDNVAKELKGITKETLKALIDSGILLRLSKNEKKQYVLELSMA